MPLCFKKPKTQALLESKIDFGLESKAQALGFYGVYNFLEKVKAHVYSTREQT